MTLPSNSSMKYYPNNTLSEFVTKLPQHFDLVGEWEVGLSEIQFPISWYNISDHESKLFIKIFNSINPMISLTYLRPAVIMSQQKYS